MSTESTDFIRQKVIDDTESGKFRGRVATRFPPEPNGYLHIGHAKSILLNFGIASEFSGTCNLRFDDTNPEAEEQKYVDAIQEDLAWLECVPSGDVRYASDYFDRLFEWALDLIDKGLAYVDDSDAITISKERGRFGEPGVHSAYRDRPPEVNQDLFIRMRLGEFPDGSKTLRARIDMASDDMILRDPVLYRIRRLEHARTGFKWCIYPTYDWAHGQSDAIEGITHSLCTLEFKNHRPLYDLLLNNLDLPYEAPEQTEFARLELTHTLLSKRGLRRLVEEGLVDGWDDPRMPTLSGIRRRGYPASAIRSFVDHIGVSTTNSTVEIELLESFVRTELNRTAQRRMGVLRPLKLTITNWPADQVTMVSSPNNPEDPDAGSREIPFTGTLWIERDDFMVDAPKKFYRLTPGREVRLRSAFFVTATEAITDDGNVIEVLATYDPETEGGSAPDGRKVKSTMHWVSAEHAVDATVYEYGRLFSEEFPDNESDVNPESRVERSAKLEPTCAEVEAGQVIQFERLGYYAADPCDGELVFHQTVGLRDEWANIQKRRAKEKKPKGKQA